MYKKKLSGPSCSGCVAGFSSSLCKELGGKDLVNCVEVSGKVATYYIFIEDSDEKSTTGE